MRRPPTEVIGDELALVQRVLRGDDGAWRELVSRISDLVYSVCATRCPPAEVEPAYRWVLQALRATDFTWLRRFDGRASLTTYLTLSLPDALGPYVLERRRYGGVTA